MELRDKLNSLEGYQEIIEKNIKYIQEYFLEIKSLEEDEKKGSKNIPNQIMKL